MKCTCCHGTGKMIECVVTDTVSLYEFPCRKCNGTGEVTATNEEWFCELSTEEKADALTHKIMDIICWNNDPKPSEVYITIKNWLKREHE